jgi:chromosome segregation protein
VNISRELKQNGDNNYFLNGKRIQKSSLSEILHLILASPGGLNITAQGMVTRISDLLPDEKRRLIEGVVGIEHFNEKKAAAEKQLKEADVKLQIALARVNEIKNRVDSLEGERNDQLRLKQLEEEIRWLKSVIISRDLNSIKLRTLKIKKDSEVCINKLNITRIELSDLKVLIQRLEDKRKEFVSDILDDSGTKHVDLEFNIAKLTSDIDRLNVDINECSISVDKTNETLPTLYRMKDEKNNEIENAKKEIRILREKLKELRKNEEEVNSNLSQIQKHKVKYGNDLSKIKALEIKIQQKIINYNKKIDDIKKKISETDVKKTTFIEKLSALKDKSDSFSKTLERLNENLNELKLLKESEKETLNKIKTSIYSTVDLKKKIESNIIGAISILDKAGGTIIKFEERNKLAEKIAPNEIGVKKLEELAEAGAITGFLGRLDNFLKYDEKYELAVFASARKWLHAAVVTDISAMLKIAEIAKRLKMGRLLMIPLSEVSSDLQVSNPPLDRVIAPTSKLISVNEGYEGLANFVFGDTLIMKTPKDAYLASLNGYRAVTLAGDLFEPKHTAFETGFFKKVDSIINLILDESSLSTMKESSSSLRKMIEKRKSDLHQLEKKSIILDTKKIQKVVKLERLTSQFVNINNFVLKYSKLEKNILKRITEIETILKRLDGKITKLSVPYDLNLKKMEVLDDKLKNLNAKSIEKRLEDLDEERTISINSLDQISNDTRELMNQLTQKEGNLEHNLKISYDLLIDQINRLEKEREDRIEFLKLKQPAVNRMKEKFSKLKIEESELIESRKKSKPIIEEYETDLKNSRKKEDNFLTLINKQEKELVSINKNMQSLEGEERRLINELFSLGFSNPTEVFNTADTVLEQISQEYEQLKDSVNLLADGNYRDISIGYKNLSLRKNQLEKERNAIVHFIESVEAEKRHVFMIAFEKIDKELRLIFNKLTDGSAWLEIENPNDIFAGGIFLMTQFPNKVPRESTSISGGEKTVTALTFILAMQTVYPSPFYLFDEIDAHLDVVNVDKLADLLREKSEKSQIILVTLKPSVLTRAALIHGVYVDDGFSRVLKYKPGMEVMVRSGKR